MLLVPFVLAGVGTYEFAVTTAGYDRVQRDIRTDGLQAVDGRFHWISQQQNQQEFSIGDRTFVVSHANYPALAELDPTAVSEGTCARARFTVHNEIVWLGSRDGRDC
jgi:hypothetical protein